MGTSVPDSPHALVSERLKREIPTRMERALAALAVASECSATQQMQSGGGGHAESSIPAGVLRDQPAADGTPSRDRSLFDHYAHRWNTAFSPFLQRLVCYQAELAVHELRHAPRASEGSTEWEARVIRDYKGHEALYVAVRERCSLALVRMIRKLRDRDPEFGWPLDT